MKGKFICILLVASLMIFGACSKGNNLTNKARKSLEMETRLLTEGEKLEFFPDKISTEGMGEKLLLKENLTIDKSEILSNSTISLAGYQLTQFVPNENQGSLFFKYDKGAFVLTLQLFIQNGEKEDIYLNRQRARLTVDGGRQLVFNENKLSPHGIEDVIKQGEKGETLLVFILDGEQYEELWEDQSFIFEYGPLQGVERIDLSKGKRVSFSLPK